MSIVPGTIGLTAFLYHFCGSPGAPGEGVSGDFLKFFGKGIDKPSNVWHIMQAPRRT